MYRFSSPCLERAVIALAAGVLVAAPIGQLSADDGVLESERQIPLAYDVDVVVVGGTTRGVSAALAARESGSSVFLMAERPYLGADICATYRLWIEDSEIPAAPLAKALFGAGMPSLLKVKRVLDDALLEKGIDFLYGCYVTDVLRDSSGNLGGIVMANRSGRQAVRAKVIIDASERGAAARIAGAEFTKYPSGRREFKRRVVGGEPPPDKKDVEFLGRTIVIKSDARRRRLPPTTNAVYEYALDIDMKDGQWASFARAEVEARRRTWQDGQVDSSEVLFQVPPDRLKSEGRQKGKWKSARELDLSALKPKGMECLYVLGGCADVSREAAGKLVRPIQGLELGALVGRAAATDAEARDLAAVSALVVAGPVGGKDCGEIGEMLNGLRSKPGLGAIQTVRSPERALPVLGRYDVVVVGGGTGGAPAAIGAARGGAKVLVIEYLNGLGGVGTMGRVSGYYHGNRVGFTAEMSRTLGDGWNVEQKMNWYLREIVEAGGEIWFHTLGCGSLVKDGRFAGVVVATPGGRGVVLANTVIDSTGNSVIPACAGVPCQEIGGEHISVQGTGLPTFAPGVGFLNGDWTFNDDSDVLDMWRTFVVGKRKVDKDKPGFQDVFDQGQLITTRARRRIIGDILITPMDIINERTYPDVITIAKSDFDNHGFSSHELFMIMPPKSRVGYVPYRALMPKDCDGILVTGLGISAHGDAMPVLRMQADVQNQGYAAGYAAALAAKVGTTVRNIDVKELQKHLVDVGIIPADMLDAEDSYPIADDSMREAVDKTAAGYDGIPVILTDPARAIPLLKQALDNAADDESRLRYAHVLGILGEGSGADVLIAAVESAEWDKGWNFRGMGQYGPTTSPVDNLVIALGRTRDRRAVEPVIRMLNKLTNKSEFSHCRAVAMALEQLGDARGAPPLARLLMEDGVMGHAFTDIRKHIEVTPGNWADTSTRNRSLRELILARALYRCGDKDGLGEKVLRDYARDLRGHYATHAKAVLSERP